MNKGVRLTFDILAPALLGTILTFLVFWDQMAATGRITAVGFSQYLCMAYIFGIIPSLIYAWVIELLFRKGLATAKYLIPISTLLGLVAGFIIQAASEFPATWFGAAVGLIMGGVLSLTKKSHREPVSTFGAT